MPRLGGVHDVVISGEKLKLWRPRVGCLRLHAHAVLGVIGADLTYPSETQNQRSNLRRHFVTLSAVASFAFTHWPFQLLHGVQDFPPRPRLGSCSGDHAPNWRTLRVSWRDAAKAQPGAGGVTSLLTLRDGRARAEAHFPLAGRSALSAVRCHRRIDAAFRPGAQTSPGLPLPLASAPCLSAQDGFL